MKAKSSSLFIILLLMLFTTVVHAFWATSIYVNSNNDSIILQVGTFELPQVNPTILIEGGSYHSVAIDLNGKLWSWGNNANGQLGNGSSGINVLTPKLIPNLDNIVFSTVSAGNYHNIAIDSSGKLWSWGGSGNYGLLGTGIRNPQDILTPTLIPNMANHQFVKISAGNNHNLAIDTNGNLWSWGRNNHGELGTGDNKNQYVPIQLMTQPQTTFSYVAAGEQSSYAIDINGNLWSWGYHGANNSYLGNEKNGDVLVPTRLDNLLTTTFMKVAAGKDIFVAIDCQNHLWSWGHNQYGGLGNGLPNYTNTPTLIPSVATQKFLDVSIDSLSDHVIARDVNNKLWVWGDNSSAQLGNGTNFNLKTPYLTQLPCQNNYLKDYDIVSISAGSEHCLAVDANGKIWSWGYNNNGQIGVGTTNIVELPTEIFLMINA